jgi:hypothetical protein
MEGSLVIGLLELVALALAPVLAVSALVRVNLAYEACVRLGRRVYLLETPPEPPVGPPLEKLAADLRRLRPAARTPRPDTPPDLLLRTLTAYDEALVGSARALSVTTTLAGLPEGFDREVERRRLERALEAAGLSW